MHTYLFNKDETLKLAFFILATVFILTGCSNKLTPTHDHSPEVISKKVPANKVLNCSTPSGHHVYKREYICPIDGERFDSLQLGTHSTYGRHLDWEPISYMRFPAPIPVCPTSGFVVTQSEYTDSQLKVYKDVVSSKKYTELYNQKHASYFLYAKTLEFSNEKSTEQWWLYLNATWEADNCENGERYKEYAYLVINEGQLALTNLKNNVDDYWVINIVIPNMYRRLGEFSKAEEYIKKLGTPLLEDEGSNEFFSLALNLLKSAISDKSTKRVPIK